MNIKNRSVPRNIFRRNCPMSSDRNFNLNKSRKVTKEHPKSKKSFVPLTRNRSSLAKLVAHGFIRQKKNTHTKFHFDYGVLISCMNCQFKVEFLVWKVFCTVFAHRTVDSQTVDTGATHTKNSTSIQKSLIAEKVTQKRCCCFFREIFFFALSFEPYYEIRRADFTFQHSLSFVKNAPKWNSMGKVVLFVLGR